MPDTDLNIYRELLSDRGREALAEADALLRELPLNTAANRLRKRWSSEWVALVLQQCRLRRKAALKFPFADRMFFTPIGLEQATDWWTAEYKARSFSNRARVADFCCGIGGDLLGIARHAIPVGIDRDPLSLLFAEANHRACLEATGTESPKFDAEFHCSTVESFPHAHDCWHLDPDRRPKNRRTTRVELHEPGPDVIDSVRKRCPDGLLKLAPAAEIPATWERAAELEWISRRRECRQLVVRFGNLATHLGSRCATILIDNGTPEPAVARTIYARRDYEEPIAASQPGDYLYTPDPAVIAGRLVDDLATELGLARVDSFSAYLTGPLIPPDPAVQRFQVEAVLPFRPKKIRPLLAERRIGRLEIKTWGVPVDIEKLRKQLRVTGQEAGVLLITRKGKSVVVFFARRVDDT
ncbi:class I SAM-dependent methyltransferase [Thermostilla marina]